MDEPIRAGGHVLCESGWEPEALPRPVGVPAAGEQAEMDGQPGPAVNAETGEETPAGEPLPEAEPEDAAEPDEHDPEPGEAEQRDRAQCPDCGRDFAVNKDGTLRKHTCVIDAPPPAVTFDSHKESD